jgi:hypothetical protein
MSDEPFSVRQGYVQPRPIVHREDLPESVRMPIYRILKKYLKDEQLSETLTSILKPYAEYEEQNLIWAMSEPMDVEAAFRRTEWFYVYEVIEAAYGALRFYDKNVVNTEIDEDAWRRGEPDPAEEEFRSPLFREELNKYFVYAGIGWQLDESGKVVSREDKNFTQALETAKTALTQSNRPTAAGHLEFARQALSERPVANTAGAVSQSTSAVEALLHDIAGRPQKKKTLSDYLKESPDLLHPALREALNKIYGYACDEGARHGKEGTQPTPEEARFVLTTCAAICTLLTEANSSKT